MKKNDSVPDTTVLNIHFTSMAGSQKGIKDISKFKYLIAKCFKWIRN